MQENLLKITNAVYKILDFLPDSDPLKNKAKEKTLAILERGTLLFGKHGWLSVGSYLAADRESIATQMAQDMEVLEQYLVIGKQQGWIDVMNFVIVTKEYRQIKDHISLSGILVKKPLTPPSYIGPPSRTKASESKQPEKKFKPTGNYSPRQQKILRILLEKERLQVKDIIKEIPEVTKRTLRRDLDDLLKKGKISRIGEFNAVFYQTLDRT